MCVLRIKIHFSYLRPVLTFKRMAEPVCVHIKWTNYLATIRYSTSVRKKKVSPSRNSIVIESKQQNAQISSPLIIEGRTICHAKFHRRETEFGVEPLVPFYATPAVFVALTELPKYLSNAESHFIGINSADLVN